MFVKTQSLKVSVRVSNEKLPLRQILRLIPATVWGLGIATFLMNASTIIILGFSPLFLTTAIGLSAFGVGLIEGVVECVSWVMRIFSGILSDYFRRRKIFILVAYGLSALARPIFPMADSVAWIFVGRLLDRIANGLQATPREALIADISPPHLKGACFGLRQTLGTAGSACGALLGVVVMEMTNSDFRTVFWVAVIPALLAFAVLVFMTEDDRFSQEYSSKKEAKAHPKLFEWRSLRAFPASFWVVIGVTMLFLAGRYSGTFLVLWAEKKGMPLAYAPLVMVVYNILSSLSSLPLGAASDRYDRRYVLALGFVLLAASDIVLAQAPSFSGVMVGVMLWGLQFGIIQSIPVAMVADRAPHGLRGTAFGIYYLGCSVALLLASTTTGWITKNYGSVQAFYASAVLALVATAGVVLIRPAKERATLAPSPKKSKAK